MNNSQEDSQWECPRCTLLVDVKVYKCPVCSYRKPRAICVTPEVDSAQVTTTPEIQKKIST